MKNIVLTLLLLGGLSCAAMAQRKDVHAELPGSGEVSAVQVDEMTRQMCNVLHLNEAQYIKLRTANQIKLARIEEISWQFKDNVAEKRAKIGELEAQYEMECGRILTPSQLSMLRNEQQRDAVPAKADPTEGGLG